MVKIVVGLFFGWGFGEVNCGENVGLLQLNFGKVWSEAR